MGSLSGKGLLISIEGPDGAGKTTQACMLQRKLGELGLEVMLTREPGGTPIGEEVRKILLNPLFTEMTVPCEVALYCAARVQLVEQVIRPSLEKGIIVISDRFIDSSTVYQGYAGGEDLEIIRKLNIWVTGALRPDKTFLLDLPAEKGLERLQEGTGSLSAGDRMEQKNLDFHCRVRDGFLQLAMREPQRFIQIDAEKTPQEVHLLIWEHVKTLLRERYFLLEERGNKLGI